MEEKKEMKDTPVQEEDLEAVNGGKYTIVGEETIICPFCVQKHPVGVIGGKQTVGRYIRKLYYCRSAKQYFYKDQGRYYDINGELLPIGDIMD
jgi:hypothetical protein